MKTLCVAVVAAWALLAPRGARADFPAELRAAGAVLQPVLKEAEALVAEGRVDEASEKLLAAFPAKTRTPAQTMALANALFKQDMKASYKLRQEAAKELPDEPNAHFEWALEQHRAGEYDGAAQSYTAYNAAYPNFAPAYGLLAECQKRGSRLTHRWSFRCRTLPAERQMGCQGI